MTYSIEDLSLDELNIIALAVDYFLNNYDEDGMDMTPFQDLLVYLDVTAEIAEECDSAERLVGKTDNLLVVDFTPKSG